MDYAKSSSRAAKTAPEKAAAIAPAKRGAVPARVKPQAGCHRSDKQALALCPAGDAANGFLKLRFLPHHCPEAKYEVTEQEESEFYYAFSQMCHFYGITPIETRHLGYPYSREVALWDALRLLRKRQGMGTGITIIKQDRVQIEVTENYRTGNTLYYIPVVPLYYMTKSRRTRKAAELLLSVCSYLWHVAGVPYYRDEGNYLNYQYDMIGEWVETDPEEWGDDYWHNRSQIHTATYIGDVMQRRIWNSCHLNSFAKRVQDFKPWDSVGCDCLTLAEKALGLCRDYPKENIYRNADTKVLPLDAEVYDETDCITMDKYIGFCAETQGWLYNTLSECVNAEFNECSELQEPVLCQTFGSGDPPQETLDFECRLFEVIEDLCTILNTIEYGNP